VASYVYGVVDDAMKPPSRRGVGDAPLQLVSSGGSAALVSELPQEHLEMGREELLTHAQVLEDALQHGTVLPMRFGVVLESAEAVQRELLDAHAEELRSQLQQFAGKVEMRVRVTYEEAPLMREIVRENATIARLRDSLRGQSDDATYYVRIELGELVADAINRKREAEAEQILGLLASQAEAVDVADPSHERIVLDASFLVDRRNLAQFDDLVERIAREQSDRLRVRLTGPLPAHSFVSFSGAG
jgi:hypothetical protein